VRRYFEVLARDLPVRRCRSCGVWVQRVGVAWRPRHVAPATVAAIIDYGMRRKRARLSMGPLRLAFHGRGARRSPLP
jgi:hypothetical protein